jgi:hypothetical protein
MNTVVLGVASSVEPLENLKILPVTVKLQNSILIIIPLEWMKVQWLICILLFMTIMTAVILEFTFPHPLNVRFVIFTSATFSNMKTRDSLHVIILSIFTELVENFSLLAIFSPSEGE